VIYGNQSGYKIRELGFGGVTRLKINVRVALSANEVYSIGPKVLFRVKFSNVRGV
jgi:hypothetical protein